MILNQFCNVKMPHSVEPCRFLSFTRVLDEDFAYVLVGGKKVLVKDGLLREAEVPVQRRMVGLIEGGG